MTNTAILGSGIYLPQHTLDNSFMEELLELEEGSIEKKTGIKERRWARETAGESIEYMAEEAAVNAVKNAGIRKIDAIILPRDVILTRRAYSISLPLIKRLEKSGINVDDCYAIDLVNYCPGFVHGVHIADLMVRNDDAENVLVVASTKYADMVNTNRYFNKQFKERFDRYKNVVTQYSLTSQDGDYQTPASNAFLWGNGAGAVVIGTSKENKILKFKARTSKNIKRNVFGIGEDKLEEKGFASLDGRAIYKYAVTEVPIFIEDFLREANMNPLEISALVPHQPNPRILDELSKRIPIPSERMLVSCDTLGNMIAASVPITYHLGKESGKIKSGDKVFFCSFGDSYLTTSGLLFEEG